MDFNQIALTINENETYESLAQRIIDRDGRFENPVSDNFLKEIAYGLSLYLHKRKLIAGESVNVIERVSFYLNVTQVKTRGNLKNENTTVNKIAPYSKHLFFHVREFKDYKSYAWLEKEPNWERIHGQIGEQDIAQNGDKTQYSDVKNGYIYVYNKDGDLLHAFSITNGIFQEVLLNSSDVSHSQKTGPERNCGALFNYFDEGGNEKENCKFVYSSCKLSKARLFGDSQSIIPPLDPDNFYRSAIWRNETIRRLNDKRTGAQILADNRNGISQTVSEYHLRAGTFPGFGTGIYFYYPNPLKELERRSKIFQERFEAKETWECVESRQQQLFIYSTIQTMIWKDKSMKRFASEERMRLWKDAYNKEHTPHCNRVVYGSENLVAWLQSKELHQCMLNHLASDSKEDQDYAIATYANALKYLGQTRNGRSFAKEEFKNPESILNYLLNIDGSKSVSSLNGETNLAGVLLKDNWFNKDGIAEFQAAARKAEQGILSLFKEAAPLAIKFLGSGRFMNLIQLTVNGFAKLAKLPTIGVNPLSKVSLKTDIIDVQKLQTSIAPSKLDGPKVGAFIAVVEAVNIGFMTYALVNNEKDKGKNLACLVGAIADFGADVLQNPAANNFIFKSIAKNKWAKAQVIAGKSIPGLQLISGAIDCFVGVDNASSAYNSGELGVAAGFMLYGIGGAVVAAGAAMKMAGVKSTITTAGTKIEVTGLVILGGTLLEGFGLALVWYWDNKAIKDWINDSIFGDNTRLVKDYDKFKDVESDTEIVRLLNIPMDVEITDDYKVEITSKQIDSINNIMCEYRLNVKFDDTNLGTKVTVEIMPGIITEYATISFKNMRAFGFARGEERHRIYSNPYSTTITGKSREEQAKKQFFKGEVKCYNPVIELDKVGEKPLYVERTDDGTIKKVKQQFFFDEDIDKITGEIVIDFNNNNLQKLPKAKQINETAKSWE